MKVEHVAFLPVWRWRPLIVRGKRITVQEDYPAMMIRWGFWQVHVYWREQK